MMMLTLAILDRQGQCLAQSSRPDPGPTPRHGIRDMLSRYVAASAHYPVLMAIQRALHGKVQAIPLGRDEPASPSLATALWVLPLPIADQIAYIGLVFVFPDPTPDTPVQEQAMHLVITDGHGEFCSESQPFLWEPPASPGRPSARWRGQSATIAPDPAPESPTAVGDTFVQALWSPEGQVRFYGIVTGVPDNRESNRQANPCHPGGSGFLIQHGPDVPSPETSPALMARALCTAWMRQEFQVHYQPQVSFATNQVVGAEALLRWTSVQGPVSPEIFIPAAEESGLIAPLGRWVLQTACHQNRQWQDQGYPPIRMAVNLSVRQLRDPTFIDLVDRALNDCGLDPAWLELEITEGSALLHEDWVVAALQALRTRGIAIALDDFGMGFSTLRTLQLLPMTHIKIDHAFIRHLPHNPHDRTIVTAIVHLAQQLGLEVTAEGVETVAQYQLLHALGCDRLQGFLCSPAIAPDQWTNHWEPYTGQWHAAPGASGP